MPETTIHSVTVVAVMGYSCRDSLIDPGPSIMKKNRSVTDEVNSSRH